MKNLTNHERLVVAALNEARVQQQSTCRPGRHKMAQPGDSNSSRYEYVRGKQRLGVS